MYFSCIKEIKTIFWVNVLEPKAVCVDFVLQILLMFFCGNVLKNVFLFVHE